MLFSFHCFRKNFIEDTRSIPKPKAPESESLSFNRSILFTSSYLIDTDITSPLGVIS